MKEVDENCFLTNNTKYIGCTVYLKGNIITPFGKVNIYIKALIKIDSKFSDHAIEENTAKLLSLHKLYTEKTSMIKSYIVYISRYQKRLVLFSFTRVVDEERNHKCFRLKFLKND